MIEFIIPAYNRFDALMCLISSLKAQTCNKWTAHIVFDGKAFYRFITLGENVQISELSKRYNDWGHTPRNYGLQRATADWVVMTGDDNYYMPTFVEEVLNAANDDVKFIYCNMVHNFTNSKNPLDQKYVAIDCAPRWGQIDIGNSVYRTTFAKQMQLDVTKETADGHFCEEYIRRFPGLIVKIPKILYVHN